MRFSTNRRLAALFLAFALPISGCVGAGSWKQNSARPATIAPVDPSAVAGHSDASRDTTIQLVSHASDAQAMPVADPAPLPVEQTPSAGSEMVPLPFTVGENTALDGRARQINLSSALAGVSGQNPQVAFATERINEALALSTGARTLWLPSIRAGVFYGNHEGPLQANDGTIPVSNRWTLEAGLGMGANGGGSPAVPGVVANFQVADAVFQPRIADQQVAARQHATRATTHDLLLSVAVAYLDLLKAYQQQAIAQETLSHTEQLAELTAAYARTGQGNQADADRAQTELALRRNFVAQATAQTRIASARLAELLNLEPTSIFVPEEPTIVPIGLVAHEAKVGKLVADGLSCRPELSESQHLVAEAVHRLEREQYAPLLPSVLLGMSQGGYGGGPGDTMSDFRGRFDLDATAYWQLRNFGFGEAAARQAARSQVEQAKLVQVRLMDQVAREIVEAHTQSESLHGQIGVAESGICVAVESYARNVKRIRGGEGLPLEVLQSLQALDQSRREYLRVVSDYDEWQFRLYRALGCPIPREASLTQ